MREAGELTNPVIQVYGRLNVRDSADDAFYPWCGLDVLSNERRLAGECRCLDMILHEKLRETCWGRCPRSLGKEDKSRVVFTSDSLRKQAGIHVCTLTIVLPPRTLHLSDYELSPPLNALLVSAAAAADAVLVIRSRFPAGKI